MITPSPGIPVLMYHGVGDGPAPLSVSTADFEAHLAAFSKAGYRTLTLAALGKLLAEGSPLPGDGLVLTFDDGYRSFFTEVAPRLRERGFVASVYLVASFMGRDDRWPSQGSRAPARPMISWSEAARLAEQGFELGAHSLTHAPLVKLSREAAASEILGSKREIEERTGATVSTFAYPYGACDAAAREIASEGFTVAAGTRLGFVTGRSPRFELPRIDSYYLSPAAIGKLREPSFARALAVRQVLRDIRRLVRPDYR